MKILHFVIPLSTLAIACLRLHGWTDKPIAVDGPKGPSGEAELAIYELLLRTWFAESEGFQEYVDSGRTVYVGTVDQAWHFEDPPDGLVSRLSDLPGNFSRLSDHSEPNRHEQHVLKVGVRLVRWNGSRKAEAQYAKWCYYQTVHVVWHTGKLRIDEYDPTTICNRIESHLTRRCC